MTGPKGPPVTETLISKEEHEAIVGRMNTEYAKLAEKKQAVERDLADAGEKIDELQVEISEFKRVVREIDADRQALRAENGALHRAETRIDRMLALMERR